MDLGLASRLWPVESVRSRYRWCASHFCIPRCHVVVYLRRSFCHRQSQDGGDGGNARGDSRLAEGSRTPASVLLAIPRTKSLSSSAPSFISPSACSQHAELGAPSPFKYSFAHSSSPTVHSACGTSFYESARGVRSSRAVSLAEETSLVRDIHQ